jgi:hypothetical protein
MRSSGFLAAIAAAFFAVGGADAATVRDQGQIYLTDGRVILGTDFFSQSITAGISGDLVALEVLYEDGVVEPVQFSIYSGGNPVSGDLLFSELITDPVFKTDEESPFVFRWDLSGANLYFDAGTQFIFAFQAATAGVQFSASDPPDYLGGELYQNGFPSSQVSDLAFITYVQPIPLPPSLALFASACVGTGLIVRRRHRT